MKKLILSAFAVLFTLSIANAQALKPQQGSVTADFGLFQKGILNSSVELNNGFLKGRYFLKDDLALRGAFKLSSSSETDTHIKNLTTKRSKSEFNLAVGLEKHFAGTDRLSPYVGFDLGIGSISAKTSRSYTDSSKNTVDKSAPIFGINGNLLFGADYYVAQHLYLGVEAGLSLSNYSEGKSSHSSDGKTDYSEKQGSKLNLDTDLFAGFKLGFVF